MTLKKKGKKLQLATGSEIGAYGHNCGQGCDDSCGTISNPYTGVQTDHVQWLLTGFEPN